MNRGNGGNRGNTRGRGQRGSPRARGRGRGFSRGRGRGGFNNLTRDPYDDGMDFVVQQWPEGSYSPSPRGWTPRGGRGSNNVHNTPRGNGKRGRGFSPSPYNSPGPQTPTRSSGRGRGRGTSMLPANAPLSMKLLADRPLLKPVIFVRSVYTATLFEQEEEIFQSVIEEVDNREESHAPTAERINRVFSGEADDASTDEEELEVVDFSDLARIREAVDAAPLKQRSKTIDEPRFTGHQLVPDPSQEATTVSVQATEVTSVSQATVPSAVDTPKVTTSLTPAAEILTGTTSSVLHSTEVVEEKLNNVSVVVDASTRIEVPGEEPSPFYVDTSPTAIPKDMVPPKPPRIPTPPPDTPPDDDDIVLYPRHSTQPSAPNTHATAEELPPPEQASAPVDHPSVSFSFADSPAPRLAARKGAPAFTPRERRRATLKQRLRETRLNKKRTRGSFGLYGAIVSEAQLHQDEDPKFEERRRGDSDIDWGDEEEEDGDGLAEGMQLDDEIELDEEAMRSFVRGMGEKGGQWVSGNDIADTLKIEAEDEEEEQNGTSALSASESGDERDSGEEEKEELDIDAILEAEERRLVGEPPDSEEISDYSDEDEGASPRSSFQTRLDKIRKASRGKKVRESPPTSEDEDEDDFDTWAAQDEDFIAEIQDIIDENRDILMGRDRKAKNRLFRAIRDGDFDFDMDSMIQPARRKKRKGDGLPAELKAQWEKDRLKKAERKRLREQAKLLTASDPLAKKKGGKKGKKAMLAAARLSPTYNPINVLPNRITSMASLEEQIRRFLEELDGPDQMSLPPMDKATRKLVHHMALAFNLKSQSKGKGKMRYTTLIKTTRSGLNVNERKVAQIVKSGRNWTAPDDRGSGRSAVAPKHKDGDAVGKFAPKITESNIGFRMLAQMGWSEGDTIGVSGGLDVPLVAIMKNTKLGLGATR